MAKLTTSTSVRAELLDRLSGARVKEAALLAKQGFHATAIYLGGYAVECLLKAMICRRLDQEALPVMFHSHDLEALLFFSGLTRRMEANKPVHRSFAKVKDMWKLDTDQSIRYRDPASVGEKDWRLFFRWLNHEKVGVMAWLRSQKI